MGYWFWLPTSDLLYAPPDRQDIIYHSLWTIIIIIIIIITIITIIITIIIIIIIITITIITIIIIKRGLSGCCRPLYLIRSCWLCFCFNESFYE